MTRDDIIRMAREAGFTEPGHLMNPWIVSDEELERFAALVASQEREACAKFVENCNGELGCHGYLIRARGEKA